LKRFRRAESNKKSLKFKQVSEDTKLEKKSNR